MGRKKLKKVKTVVVKAGTSILAGKGGSLSPALLKRVTQEILFLLKKGVRVVFVSSGAIASGVHQLRYGRRPKEISELQACAAVGQPILMQAYQKLFARAKVQVGQILITRDDLENKKRFLHAKHTLKKLLKHKILPIVNENDSVVVEEIKVGDNDNLAAHVAILAEADLLIILTDQDGFYTRDPSRFSDAKLITTVQGINKKTEGKASGTSRATSIGGMQTKIQAAKLTGRFGIPTLIANGKTKGIMRQVINGEIVGTLFLTKRFS
ncbi:MAG: glutamate 5-kinase [Deltaproteobacteria bacterium]|nr:glutamate 5-kinase [Deltaproteobacteria bacterium]